MIIWKKFEKNFARNCVKNDFFFFQKKSVENSLICPKNKSASHCPTELFPIYPNIHWTIRRRDDHIVVPSSNSIKLKIDWIQLKPKLSELVLAKFEIENPSKSHLKVPTFLSTIYGLGVILQSPYSLDKKNPSRLLCNFSM